MSSDDMPPAPGPQPGPQPGAAPPAGATRPGPDSPRDGFFDAVRRMGLARSDDRWVGGVAGGLAERLGVDPLLVRGLLILSFFLTGAGFVLYAVAWALLPERRDGRIHLQEAIRGNFDPAMLGAVVAFVVGIGWNDGVWSWWGAGLEWLGALFWIAVWVAVVVLVVQLVRSRRRPSAQWTPPPGAGPTPPAPTSTSYTSAPTTGPAESGTGTGTGTGTGSGTGTGTAPFAPAPPASYVSAPAASSSGYASDPAPSGYSSGYYPPGAPSAATQPSKAPKPPKPRRERRGPGGGAVGTVLGLILLTGAVLLVSDRVDGLDVPFWPTWIGAAIAITGIGIVVSGMRGRTGGGLSGLAILGAFAASLVWLGPVQNDWGVWDGPRITDGTSISEGTLTLRTVAEAENGADVRFGNPTIDLTELDLSDVLPGEPIEVPVGLTAGSVRILVPEDEAVEAQVRMLAGNIRWHVGGESRAVAGVSTHVNRFASPEATAAEGSRLLVLVDARAGEITIEESA